MSSSEMRRLDREIRKATQKLEAVRRGEWWPLNGRERRAMTRALAGGSYRAARGRDLGGAEEQVDTTASAAETRLTAELNALYGERQRLITEQARTKAAKKKSGWW
ncbi:hypothetical protein GL263_26340 [Streptomyces durbertensis]|uniref:Uncharacterized protein n=1 Tax=Streptomyces durbertensis TaxID=2448886 RepID=A0ABR6ENX3_9ACTN|nr:hypothetical protein [Streptomyces durbertensis]MBB1247039.1 hypothetical protein [Streptomyces durbertensis]